MDELIKAYYEARAKYEDVKESATAAHKVRVKAEQALIDAMLASHTRKVGRDDGTTISLRNSVKISSTEDNRGDLLAFISKMHADGSLNGCDYSQQTPNKKALLEFITDALEDGTLDPDDLPESMGYSTRPTISVMGWKKLFDHEDL